jgi:hypothetical protein
MNVYKLPINIFEKDLLKKIQTHSVKSKYKANSKLYFLLLAIVLSIVNVYFQLNHDFITWENDWTDLEFVCLPWSEEWGVSGWPKFVESLFSGIIMAVIWAIYYTKTEGQTYYDKKEINEKFDSSSLHTISFLKLDFLSKSKKGIDITGSLYVNNPESNYLRGLFTLHVRNRRFITTETINKKANDIKDIDDFFSLEDLRIDESEVGYDFSKFNRVVNGEKSIDVYKEEVNLIQNKYGIKVIRVEWLIFSFWNCILKDKNGKKRTVGIDAIWGNKVTFNNVN